MFQAPQHGKSQTSSIAENTSQIMFIRTDKISETVYDLDSDGGSFSELSDSDMGKVSSSFSNSSKEEEVVQPDPERTEREHAGLFLNVHIDFELGWQDQIQTVQKPAFFRVPSINKYFHITQNGSPWDIFEIFFSPKMFKLTQKETN
jgi:hypothetical protein